jgi:hypothetical protein
LHQVFKEVEKDRVLGEEVEHAEALWGELLREYEEAREL